MIRERFGAPPPKAKPIAADAILPAHEWIDDKLHSWGRWSRLHLGAVRCGSAEKNYRSPWRQWHYPSINELMPPLPNGEMQLIDRAVLGVPGDHRQALKLHYVNAAPAFVICRKLHLRYAIFGSWMRDAREMTLSNLQKLERAA